VTADLDTLLTALYVLIDDHVIPSGRRGPGRPKKLSDAELVCLAVAQVLLGARSEHHWLRLCYARLGHLFPYLPHQPGYHKRLKAAATSRPGTGRSGGSASGSSRSTTPSKASSASNATAAAPPPASTPVLLSGC